MESINKNISKVMKFNNVSNEQAIELIVDDVIVVYLNKLKLWNNSIGPKFLDNFDKPDIDYIKILLQENNYEIMKVVDILEDEDKTWELMNEIKKEHFKPDIPFHIKEIMKYGYSEERAKQEMIGDIIRDTREWQWKVCRCEWYKPLEKKDIEKLLEQYNWEFKKCLDLLKYKNIHELI